MNKTIRLQVIVLAVIRVVFNTMHRMVYPFLSAFAGGLGVGREALSTALTLRALSGAFGPLVAPVADTRGRKTGLLLGLGFFTLGISLLIIFPSYLTFILTLILTNIGNLTFIPAMQAYLGDRVPYERRGFAVAVTEMGWSLSFILTVPLAGLLIDKRGWSAPLPILAAFGLLSMFTLTRLLPKETPHADLRIGIWKNLRTVITTPLALAGLAMGLFYSTANETINLIFGVWMEDSFGLKIAALGGVALGIGLVELAAESLVALVTDRLGKERAVAIGLLLNCAALIWMVIFGNWIAGALSGLFFFFLTFEFTLVSVIPLMSELMPATRATLMSVNITFISLGRALGASIALPLYTASPGSSILLNAMAATGLNLLGLAALRILHRKNGSHTTPNTKSPHQTIIPE